MEPSATQFRLARESDLQAIIHLLADDQLGSQRESFDTEIDQAYIDAFHAIDADGNNELIVAEIEQIVVGVLQVTYIPNLSHMGSWRGTIEGVRISSRFRSSGLGTQLMEWAIERARKRGCRLIQLTSDLRRQSAISFYERLGFEHTHAGMKLWLTEN